MKLYIKFCIMHFKSAIQYKTSFILTVLGQFLISFSSFLAFYFMFLRFNKVNGFSFDDCMISFSVILLSYAISDCISYGFKYFPILLSTGEFDRIMLRPANELFSVLVSKIEFASIGRMCQGILITIYAVTNFQSIWTVEKVAVYILMILGGILYFVGFYILYAGFCFFTIEGLEFMNIFTDGGREFGKYPLVIYGDKILKFFTYIIPLACVQYYPLLYLLDRNTSMFAPIAPLSLLIFFFLCISFWKFGVRNYKSTGS